jgi:hypothetical protein
MRLVLALLCLNLPQGIHALWGFGESSESSSDSDSAGSGSCSEEDSQAGKCKGDTIVECVDSDNRCEQWANAGDCKVGWRFGNLG